LVNATYSSKTLFQIVDDINTNYLDGETFTTGSVATGPTITKAIFSRRTVGEAFDLISEDTGYQWFIDASRVIHFYETTALTSTVNFSVTNRPFRTMIVEDSLDNYTNFVTLRAGQGVTSARTETFTGDSQRRVFNLAFPVAEKPSDIQLNSVSVAASEIGIRGLDTGKTYYWSKGTTEIEQDPSKTLLTSSDTLDVTYKGLFPIVMQAKDDPGIAARAAVSDNTSGKYERLLVDPSIETIDVAADRAGGHLRRFSDIPVKVIFTTDTSSFRPKQTINIVLPEMNLNGDFLIDSIRAVDDGVGNLIFTVTCVSGETLGGWQAYWKTQNLPQKINVGDEFIIDLRQLESKVGITMTETATSQLEYHTWDVTSWGLAETAA